MLQQFLVICGRCLVVKVASDTKSGLNIQVIRPHPQPLSQAWERGARKQIMFTAFASRI
jgi:hypothetical protein